REKTQGNMPAHGAGGQRPAEVLAARSGHRNRDSRRSNANTAAQNAFETREEGHHFVLALIPLLPFAGFLVNATLGRRLPKSVSGGLASLVMLASFVISVISVVQIAGRPVEARAIQEVL